MQAHRAQGTEDLYGGYMRAWERMQAVAAETFGPYGFDRVETPAMEQVDTFVHGIGESTDVVRKEMFRVVSGALTADALERGSEAHLKPRQAPRAAPRGHGRRRAPGGRGQPRPAGLRPRQAVVRHADVPRRAPAEGPAAPVPPGRHRVDRGPGRRRRRRDHRHAHGLLRGAGASPRAPRAQGELDGRRRVPPGLPRAGSRVSSSTTPTRCAPTASSAPRSTRCAPSTARTRAAARPWRPPRSSPTTSATSAATTTSR